MTVIECLLDYPPGMTGVELYEATDQTGGAMRVSEFIRQLDAMVATDLIKRGQGIYYAIVHTIH